MRTKLVYFIKIWVTSSAKFTLNLILNLNVNNNNFATHFKINLQAKSLNQNYFVNP